jgi:transcriptional regulator with XRE-family HTH domain
MSKKKPLTPELQAECSAANELFLAKKNEMKLTQKKIADAAGISPAAVAQYLNGTNPLNAKFAVTLSRLINEPVEKFSQRLAAEIADMAKVVAPAATPEPARHGQGEAKPEPDQARALLEAVAALHVIQAGLLAGIVSKEQLQRLLQIRNEIAHQKPGGADKGHRLQGLLAAAFRAEENGDSPDDLLRMYQLGMEKEFAKEGAEAHEPGKKPARRS